MYRKRDRRILISAEGWKNIAMSRSIEEYRFRYKGLGRNSTDVRIAGPKNVYME